MNTSASPPSPPPGLGDHSGLRPAHGSHVLNHQPFPQSHVSTLLPSDLASATALLQQYRVELQQQQTAPASFGSLPSTLNPRSAVLPAFGRGVSNASEDTPAGSPGLREADAELRSLLEIASGAFVSNNRIDLSLLSFKQRLALADLVRYKQYQLQQRSQQASLLLHQLEKTRAGYVDSSRLLQLFPSARSALASSSPQGSVLASSGPHADGACCAVQWRRPFHAVSDGQGATHALSSASSHVAATEGRASPSGTADSLRAAEPEHEHDDDMLSHVSQPFTRSHARSRTIPAVRVTPESWIEKACGDNESYSPMQEGDLFKRCFSMSSSLEAGATTTAETPGAALDDRVRDDKHGDVSTLLGEFAMLHTQQNKNVLQSVVDGDGERDDVTGTQATTEGTPFSQRNTRRTTTMPSGSIPDKVMLLSSKLDMEALQVAETGGLPEFALQSKGDIGAMWTPTVSGRNGRCVRIDTKALAAAAAVMPDYGNIIAGNDVTALLGDLKLLQEASSTVQAAAHTTPTTDANAFFQRNNRRTTTLPGTMANVKIRATDVQRMLHTKGRCKPCAFYYNKRKGCRNGSECEFCHHEEHSKLTLKQWKKHQQRAHRTRILEDCDSADGNPMLSDFQSPAVLFEPPEGSVIPSFASAHAATSSDVQPPIIPRPYALNSAGITAESLAHVRDRLAELTNASESTLSDGN